MKEKKKNLIKKTHKFKKDTILTKKAQKNLWEPICFISKLAA